MEEQVRLNRKLLKDPLWLSEPFTRGQAWVDLFAMANSEDGISQNFGRKIELKRGQCSCSENDLSKRWKWSRGKVKRFITDMQTDKRIDIAHKLPASIITICNYDKYQSGEIVYKSKTDKQTDKQTDNLASVRHIDHAGARADAQARLDININNNNINNKNKRGTRIEVEKLPPQWEYFCKHNRPDLDPLNVFETFRDYWVAIPGQKGVKVDWFATWRNWVRGAHAKGIIKKPEEKVDYHKRMENYKT